MPAIATEYDKRDREMTDMGQSLHDIVFDCEFNVALDRLRASAHEVFLSHIEDIRELSGLLVSSNEELLREIEASIAKSEALRAELSAKLLAASTLAAQDLSRVRDTTARIAHDSRAIEQFTQFLYSSRDSIHPSRRRAA